MTLSFFLFSGLLFSGAPSADPDDLQASYQSLQEATAKKDFDQVKTLAVKVVSLAKEMMSAKAPEDEAEKEKWTQQQAFARDVRKFAGYAMYAMAVQSPPAKLIEMVVAMEEVDPKSEYLDQAYGAYFHALSQTGGASKILAIAEKAITQLPDNEDLLLVLADAAMSRRQSDRALSYAERMISAIARHQKPETISAADWERRRFTLLGRGHWIAGLIHAEKNQYFEADKDLRLALPLVRGNEAMLAPVLFHLGVANYHLGKMSLNKGRVLEGAKFSEQAAAIKGPLSQQAWTNAAAMRREAERIR